MWSVFSAGYSARCLLPVHSEHLWSAVVYSSGMDRRNGRLVGGVHHRLHVLRMRQYFLPFVNTAILQNSTTNVAILLCLSSRHLAEQSAPHLGT